MPWWLVAAVVAVVVAVAIGVVAYRAGTHRSPITERSGVAYATALQATVVVDGWSYHVPLDIGWWSTSGTYNDGGTPPACLIPRNPSLGTMAPVQFGTVMVTHDSITVRQVVWLRCVN